MKIHTVRVASLLLPLAFALPGAPLHAGQFVMRTLVYTVDPYGPGYLIPGYIFVQVTGTSIYVGSADTNDKQYLIQTSLNYSAASGDYLYDWAFPDAIGNLFLDRNGNGAVDSGRELFGNLTELRSGLRARSGYEAMAELDSPELGGNGDGKLDAEDAVFGDLRVWVDRDHSGRSEAGELAALAAAGVLELSYAYHESRRTDRHGNEFRFRSAAVVDNSAGAPRAATTYDVFFSEGER